MKTNNSRYAHGSLKFYKKKLVVILILISLRSTYETVYTVFENHHFLILIWSNIKFSNWKDHPKIGGIFLVKLCGLLPFWI